MIQTNNKLRYMEIYSDIKERIASENYGAGSLLPTEGELTQLYSASRTTIRRAIALLQEDGLVKSVQGKGTEVISPKKWSRPYPFQEFRNFNHITDFRGAPLVEGEIITQEALVDVVPAEIKIAGVLSVAIGSEVYRIQRMKSLNDMVFAYVTSYVPCPLTPGLEQHSGKFFILYRCLLENYGLTVTKVEETISSSGSGFLESRLLGVAPGSPLLTFQRTAYWEGGIMEYSESSFRPDVYRIAVTMEGPFEWTGADQLS